MRRRVILIASLLLMVCSRARAEGTLVFAAQDLPDEVTSAVQQALAASDRYRVLPLSALVPLMRQRDLEDQLQQRVTTLTEEGRKALIALDHQQAKEKLLEAARLLERGFVRHYDPRVLADVYVLLGLQATQVARPDLARESFVKALHLAPELELDAHYSPQVRETFSQTKGSLPPRPLPAAADIGRVAALGEAAAALLLTGEQPDADDLLLKGVLFDREKGAFTRVETQVVTPGNREQLQRFAKNLRTLVEPLYPPPPKPPILPPPPPPPPAPKPWYAGWYKRWYVYVAAGAVLATAITLPLALRSDHVDVNARW